MVEYVPAACAGCGADLAGADDAGVMRRQVHDIPQVTTRVVEHRLHKRRCVRPGCGSVTTAAAPAGVSAQVRPVGHRRALAVYLVVFQHVPVERAAQLIADVTGARCSTGWISSVLAQTAEALVNVEASGGIPRCARGTGTERRSTIWPSGSVSTGPQCLGTCIARASRCGATAWMRHRCM